MSQVAAVLRLEWKKSLFSKRAWWIYLLAFGPVFVTAAHSLSQMGRTHPGCSISEDNRIYAGIFQLFYLRLGIFFGCVGIFSNLFRGEVLEKTLHYYLLTPMRREVLVAGKYLAGLIAAVACFAGSAVLAFLLISMHFGQEYWDFILRGPGAGQLAAYALVGVLACAGYGAVFLMMGLLFANPMIPAAAVMIWEAMNPFLPALLKKFSVIFYLKSLTPVDVPLRGPLLLLAVDADPVPAWLAIPGLLAVSALVLFYAGVRARKMEISYNE
jgi:ABC-type transport system involved in multi-copper enzyme maturation permease subunit